MPGSNSIRAIIWDMGGVLLRTESLQPRLQLAEGLGVSYSFLDDLVFSSESSLKSEMGQMSSISHWRTVTGKLGLPVSMAEDLREQWFSGDRVDRNLLAYIETLRSGYKTGMLSNAWEGTREYVERKYGLLEVFDRVLFSYEAGVRKPDPRIFEIMLSFLDVQPGEAVFIDDFEKNILGAQKAGIQAIRFLTPAQVVEELTNFLP